MFAYYKTEVMNAVKGQSCVLFQGPNDEGIAPFYPHSIVGLPQPVREITNCSSERDNTTSCKLAKADGQSLGGRPARRVEGGHATSCSSLIAVGRSQMRWLRSESPSKRVFGQVYSRRSLEDAVVMVVNKELHQLAEEAHSSPD